MACRICCLMLLVCCSLGAQTSLPLSGTIADDHTDFFMFDIDHGAMASAPTLTVSLTGGMGSGLNVTVLDVDEWAKDSPGYSESATTVGAGPLTATFTLPSRAGTHQVMVTIETSLFGPATPYTGTADLDIGAMTQAGFSNLPYDSSGARNILGRVVDAFFSMPGNVTAMVDFTMDFGAGAASLDAYLLGGTLSSGAALRLLDMSTTPPTVIFQQNSVGGDIDAEEVLVLGPYSGLVKFRLEFVQNGFSGVGGARIALGPQAVLTQVEFFAPQPPRQGGNSDQCAAGPLGPAAGALALFGVWAARKRRRGMMQ